MDTQEHQIVLPADSQTWSLKEGRKGNFFRISGGSHQLSNEQAQKLRSLLTGSATDLEAWRLYKSVA